VQGLETQTCLEPQVCFLSLFFDYINVFYGIFIMILRFTGPLQKKIRETRAGARDTDASQAPSMFSLATETKRGRNLADKVRGSRCRCVSSPRYVSCLFFDYIDIFYSIFISLWYYNALGRCDKKM
jgi:hypothetical protein